MSRTANIFFLGPAWEKVYMPCVTKRTFRSENSILLSCDASCGAAWKSVQWINSYKEVKLITFKKKNKKLYFILTLSPKTMRGKKSYFSTSRGSLNDSGASKPTCPRLPQLGSAITSQSHGLVRVLPRSDCWRVRMGWQASFGFPGSECVLCHLSVLYCGSDLDPVRSYFFNLFVYIFLV